MPIRAQCPAGHIMMVPDQHAGTRLHCPRCGVEVRVPGKPAKPPKVKKSASASSPASVAAPTATTEVEPPPLSVPQPEPAAPPIVTKALTNEIEFLEPVPTARPPRPLSFPSSNSSPPLPDLAPNLPAPKKPPPAGKPMVPDRDKQAAAFNLGLVVGALALFSVSPAVWEWFAIWQNPDAPPTPPWVFALFLAGVIQLAYAVYLAQLPDWSTLWATTAAMLIASAGYALMLGTTLMTRDESMLVELFRYADKLPGNRAAMWCFVMLCFTSVVTYFLGLTAARWYRSDRLLRKVHGR